MLRRASRSLLVPVLAVAACASDADPWAEAPDIRGRYHVILEAVSGCAGEQFLLNDWAPGALEIAGDEPRSLTFDFGDGVVLDGSVSDSWTYNFGGFLEVDGWSIGVGSSGVAWEDIGSYLLEGDLSGDADDGDLINCTITGPYTATQVSK